MPSNDVPILELIRDNILTVLATVTLANGYYTQLAPAALLPAEGNTLTPTSGIAGNDIYPVLVGMGGGQRVDNRPQLHEEWWQDFDLWCFSFNDPTDNVPPDRVLNFIWADAMKALFADRNRGTNPATSNPLAIDTRILKYERFESAKAGMFQGIAIPVAVHYRHLEGDPYSQ